MDGCCSCCVLLYNIIWSLTFAWLYYGLQGHRSHSASHAAALPPTKERDFADLSSVDGNYILNITHTHLRTTYKHTLLHTYAHAHTHLCTHAHPHSRKKFGIEIPHLMWMVIYAHPLCTYILSNVYVSCIRNVLHKKCGCFWQVRLTAELFFKINHSSQRKQ